MPHWLVKSEPSDYSFAQLQRAKKTLWTGIKNPAAKLHLRAMKTGDQVLFYHTGAEKAVVGTATITKPAAPSAADPAVEIAAGFPLPQPVTLAAIKADKRFKDWALVKIGRLSVVPTSPEIYHAILALAGRPQR